jgi:hypothetical protein
MPSSRTDIVKFSRCDNAGSVRYVSMTPKSRLRDPSFEVRTLDQFATEDTEFTERRLRQSQALC